MRSRSHQRIALLFDPAVWILLIIGFVSLGFLIRTYLSWRNGIGAYLPIIEHIEQATLDLSVGQLWLEELLMGDAQLTIEQVHARLDDAEQAIDECLSGRTGTAALPDHAPPNPDVAADLKSIKSTIMELRTLTDQRWELKGRAAIGTDMEEKYDALFGDIMTRTDIVTSRLHLVLSRDLSQRRREFLALALLWLITIIGASSVTMLDVTFTATRELPHSPAGSTSRAQRKPTAMSRQLAGRAFL